jgi:hypothetical protein
MAGDGKQGDREIAAIASSPAGEVSGAFDCPENQEHQCPGKDFCKYKLLSGWKGPPSSRLFDNLSLSRHGESSGELGSVMILDPIIGNSLAKAVLGLGQKNIT